jgi:hypothetical protein
MRGISSHSDRSVVLEVCQNSRQQRPDWHVGYRGQAPGLRTAGRGAGDGVHATTGLLPTTAIACCISAVPTARSQSSWPLRLKASAGAWR